MVQSRYPGCGTISEKVWHMHVSEQEFFGNTVAFLPDRAHAGYSFTYRAGWAVLSGSDPTTVLHRSERPVLAPELWWETGDATGMAVDPVLVPNVTFVEGMLPVPGEEVGALLLTTTSTAHRNVDAPH